MTQEEFINHPVTEIINTSFPYIEEVFQVPYQVWANHSFGNWITNYLAYWSALVLEYKYTASLTPFALHECRILVDYKGKQTWFKFDLLNA
jgi:hypothetical protein